GEEDGHIAPLRLCQRGVTPRPPVDRIGCMLQQIRRRFCRQTIHATRNLSSGDFHAKKLATKEEIIAMIELPLLLETHVRSVTAVEIGEHHASARVLETAVRSAHVEVAREVQVSTLTTNLEARASRANGHSRGTALQQLRDAERARMLGRGVEERAVRTRL